MDKPAAVEIQISKKMIEDVMNEFEREHPGMSCDAMDGKEFADRLMKKIEASARVIVGGNS